MPVKGINISKYNYEEKSMKVPFVIYADTESCLYLKKKMSRCHKSREKSSTVKVNKHNTCNYSLFTHCSFHSNINSMIIIGLKTV